MYVWVTKSERGRERKKERKTERDEERDRDKDKDRDSKRKREGEDLEKRECSTILKACNLLQALTIAS